MSPNKREDGDKEIAEEEETDAKIDSPKDVGIVRALVDRTVSGDTNTEDTEGFLRR